jgi:hypothetical protein
VTYRAPGSRTLVSVALLALFASAMLAFARPVEMTVDGVGVESDVPPVTTANDRVFVPIRSFAEALGAQTSGEDGRIDVVRGSQSLRANVGEVRATVNGTPLTLAHAPFLVRGRIMVELDAVARAFNVRARYDARTARISVFTPGIGQAPVPSPASASTQ